MKKRRKTAVEIVADANANQAFRKLQEEREAHRLMLLESERRAEAPLVAELSHVGVHVNSVWDLVESDTPSAAIPVLVEHLQQPYPERVREAMARALATPAARPLWPTLKRMFELDRNQASSGVKWALGLALAVSSDDSVLDQVIDLVRDKSHGVSRAAFIYALARSRNPRATKTLQELKGDPDLSRAAAQALRGELTQFNGS
jgi:hypothetical protein